MEPNPSWSSLVPPVPTHQHSAEAPTQAHVELLPVSQEDESSLRQLVCSTQHRLVRGHGTQLQAYRDKA